MRVHILHSFLIGKYRELRGFFDIASLQKKNPEIKDGDINCTLQILLFEWPELSKNTSSYKEYPYRYTGKASSDFDNYSL